MPLAVCAFVPNGQRGHNHAHSLGPYTQGYFLLFESMLDTVLFARDKWLADDGVGEFCIILAL